MPLILVCSDITRMPVDAIVNAANSSLLGGGGVDGCIHRAAGPELLAECRQLGGCETGDAKITGAGNLPCKYVIHAVGPRFLDGCHGERGKLVSCYRKALRLARDHDCKTIAFPLISSGIFGYPKEQALRIAIDTISNFLMHEDLMAYLVIFDKSNYQIDRKLRESIAAYIAENYSDTYVDSSNYCQQKGSVAAETFSEMVLRKMEERGFGSEETYRKANVSREQFAQICNDWKYKPSKATAIACALALELPLDETQTLLRTAGYWLSHAFKFDLIIEYFIEHQDYNVFTINEALFAFDQPQLGV